MKNYRFAAGAILLSLSLSPVLADPVDVGPPVVVDGKIAPYSRVKKNGLIWYPASVVGYQRGIHFSYDFGSRTLFANGVETQIPAVVVDDVVYVNLTPKVSQHDMRPGMNTLEMRQAELRQMEQGNYHMEGVTDSYLMSQNVSSNPHPWTSGGEVDNSPIIDLDPTGEEPLSPLMQPGARPPQGPPASLPNRLPGPDSAGTAETVSVNPTASNPQATVETSHGVPLTVTTQGGPEAGQGAVANLSPVVPQSTVKQVAPFEKSCRLKSAQAENSVFAVKVMQGDWQVNSKDRILHVKVEQANRSKVAQSSLGEYAVRCEDGSRVEASRTRSYLPNAPLAPGAGRTGELVFRLTEKQIPQSLELEGALQLSVPLNPQ